MQMAINSRLFITGRITLDCYARNEAFKFSNLQRYEQIQSSGIFLGGSAGNIAAWLHKLRQPVLLYGAIGQDNIGRTITEIIAQQGIPFFPQYTQTQSSMSIIFLDDRGEPLFFHVPGANNDFELNFIPDDFKPNDILVIAGLQLLPNLNKRWEDFYYNLNRKPPFIVASMCHGGEPGLYYPILNNTNILVGNREETEPYLHDPDLFTRFSCLQAIVMTEGKQRVSIILPSSSISVDVTPVKVIDACGAGDSFLAGLLAGLNCGQDLEISCKLGIRLSGECCQRVGPSCPPDNLYEDITRAFPWLMELAK